ncbi:RNA binding motif, single stranded interacting protein 3, partial [Cladochytrium tenue]
MGGGPEQPGFYGPSTAPVLMNSAPAFGPVPPPYAYPAILNPDASDQALINAPMQPSQSESPTPPAQAVQPQAGYFPAYSSYLYPNGVYYPSAISSGTVPTNGAKMYPVSQYPLVYGNSYASPVFPQAGQAPDALGGPQDPGSLGSTGAGAPTAAQTSAYAVPVQYPPTAVPSGNVPPSPALVISPSPGPSFGLHHKPSIASIGSDSGAGSSNRGPQSAGPNQAGGFQSPLLGSRSFSSHGSRQAPTPLLSPNSVLSSGVITAGYGLPFPAPMPPYAAQPPGPGLVAAPAMVRGTGEPHPPLQRPLSVLLPPGTPVPASPHPGDHSPTASESFLGSVERRGSASTVASSFAGSLLLTPRGSVSDLGISRTNLYIRGLANTATDEWLFNLCKEFGKISSSKAIIDLNTRECKGYGFVMYDTEEEARRAKDSLVHDGFQVSFAK